MFKKLLSNLPFNPSLISQIGFYHKRIRHEASVRFIGVALLAVALFVQMVAGFAAPKGSLAQPSNNNILLNGVVSVSDAAAKCNANVQDFRIILLNLGATCANVAAGTVQTIRSTDDGGQLYSVGRLHRFPDDVVFPVLENNQQIDTLYFRRLHEWDSGPFSTYHAVVFHNVFGIQMMVLFDCGNIVFPGKPPIPKPTPTPTPTPTPKPCPSSTDSNDILSCLVQSKSARNDTQGIASANNTLAHAGDSITYTLSVKNTANVTAKQFTIKENMSDVLFYADITDLHGGERGDQGTVFWPAEDIAAGQTVSRQITVKVKDPIPATPNNPADPGAYDLLMTNFYGNQVTIKLPSPVVKTVETTTTTLPNTGPGTSIAIGFGLTMVVGYFFARSRLMARELEIVKADFTSSGGL